MKLILLTICALTSSSAFSQEASQPKVITEEIRPGLTNIKVKGSLAKSNDLPCISFKQAQNTYTPADLYSSSAKCTIEGEHKKAAKLFYLAGAYAIYDSHRVADKTARGARSALIMKYFNPIERSQKKLLQSELNNINSGSSQESVDFCTQIIEIGKPNYHPLYMIRHGMAAITGKIQDNGLIDHYDPEQNWKKTLTTIKWCNKP